MAKMSVLNQPLAFVDIETTGGSYRYARVLEIGVVRVENGQVVREMRQLVNPGTHVPSQITQLTGITTSDVTKAPRFAEVADEFADIVEGAVFVAHNVQFDYGFLNMEFERLGAKFTPPLLCTVRLSRKLYPGERGHSLQAIIDRFGFATDARHRAYDDAVVLWDFYRHIMGEFDLDTLEAAFAAQLRSQSLPSHLDKTLVDDLPQGPGVYIFEDEAGQPLYVGKSVSIRKRVLSHFADAHSNGKELRISERIRSVRAIKTYGELGALLTEARMVKDLQPFFNRQLRRRERVVLAIRYRDADGYARIELRDTDAIDPAEADLIMAVYSTRGRAKLSLNAMARNFYLCPKLMNLEKASHECFLVQLGKCRGGCGGQEAPTEYNTRFDTAFERTRVQAWPYDGPVLVTERHPQLEGSEGIIVNQWCLTGRLREYEDGTVEEMSENNFFDLDTYKILHGYLQNPHNRSSVQPLPHVL